MIAALDRCRAMDATPVKNNEMSRAERRKQETREKLLEAALELFLEEGYEAVTTAQIAAAADLGAGTFYLHFKDKRAIYVALGKQAAQEIISHWREAISGGPTLVQMAASMIDLANQFWTSSPARARLLLEGGPPFEAEAYAELGREIGRAMGEALHANRPSVDTEAVATLVVGLSFQLGRVILAGPAGDAQRVVEGVRQLIERALS